MWSTHRPHPSRAPLSRGWWVQGHTHQISENTHLIWSGRIIVFGGFVGEALFLLILSVKDFGNFKEVAPCYREIQAWGLDIPLWYISIHVIGLASSLLRMVPWNCHIFIFLIFSPFFRGVLVSFSLGTSLRMVRMGHPHYIIWLPDYTLTTIL